MNIDIAIATKNGYPQLSKCIRHIINGKKLPKNIIIIDNNDILSIKISTEIKKLCALRQINLIYVFIPKIGLSNARNEALKHVQSPYYAFIDQDEYIPHHWLSNLDKWLLQHPSVDVVSGPKKSTPPRNYWKLIWDSLYTLSFLYEGEVDFVCSSNSCYKTAFIKKHHLKYNPKFRQSSEDVVFCYLLKQVHANVYFSKSIYLHHDFRSSFNDFWYQWFGYGTSYHLFDLLYLNGGSFKNDTKILYTIKNILLKIKRLDHFQPTLIPGYFIMNTALILGYLKGYLTHSK